jgi:hypothetical protein
MAVLGDLRLRRRVILQRARSGPLHWALVGEVNVLEPSSRVRRGASWRL